MVVVNPVEILNLRVGYAVLPDLDVVLTGYNLLDLDWGKRWRRHGIDSEMPNADAENIGRRIMLGLEAAF